MSCTPISRFTFSGSVTVNGKKTTYANQAVPIPAGVSSCYIRSGNSLTIRTTTPAGTATNTLRDVNGKITGSLSFPGATVQLNGTGKFL